MISYVKIWTSVYQDEWFLSLNCLQRGAWLQMIITAKDMGDTGSIFGKNPTELAMKWAIDRKSLVRFWEISQSLDKLIIERGKGYIHIKLLNYKYWQGLKSGKDFQKTVKPIGKIPLTDKRIEKKVEVEVEKKPPSPSTGQDQNNQNKKPVHDLDQWAKTKTAIQRFEDLACQPGYERDWIDSEFDKFHTEVLMKPDWAVKSRITNYNNDWGDMFFAWLKRAKRGGERDRFYQRNGQ